MLVFASIFALIAVASSAPTGWIDLNINDERHLGMAWDAAATIINKNVRSGRFMVPKKLMEARKRTISDVTDYEVIAIFQEAWCGPWENNTVDEICESMCPLYHGGAEAIYKITSTAGQLGAVKVEDVLPLDTPTH